MAMIPSLFSLVKYNEPVLNQKVGKGNAKNEELKQASSEAFITTCTAEDELREFLDKILPPREFEEGGHVWIQHVSSEPAGRTDAMNLQQQLHRMVAKRQARKTGICPIRRELYDQCFDELIRQVAIDCPERGLLLLRIKDEWRMTLAIYEELCESSVIFGIKKANLAETIETDSDSVIEKFQKEHDELQNLVTTLTSKCNMIEKRKNEQRALEVKKQTEEIQYMKKLNQQLKNQLEGITSAKLKLESS